jgi:hypothetical protein
VYIGQADRQFNIRYNEYLSAFDDDDDDDDDNNNNNNNNNHNNNNNNNSAFTQNLIKGHSMGSIDAFMDVVHITRKGTPR